MSSQNTLGRFAKISVAAAVAGCFSMQVLAADDVKLAITGPFSGGSAPMGVSMRDGAKLAIQEINAAGGIDVGGKKMKISVIERDDEAKNDRSALEVADYAYVMERGRVAVEGTPAQLAQDERMLAAYLG